MSRLIIQVGGGLVQDIFKMGKGPIGRIFVVDFDDEDSDEDRVTRTKDSDGNNIAALVSEPGISKLPQDSDVSLIMQEYIRGQDAVA